MKMKTWILGSIVAAIFTWTGYSVGYHVAFQAGEKRKAKIAYSDAKIMLSSIDAIKEQNYTKAVDMLAEVAKFRVFYIETTRKELSSLSLIRSIVRPDIAIGNFALNANESLPDNEEVDQLKDKLPDAAGR